MINPKCPAALVLSNDPSLQKLLAAMLAKLGWRREMVGCLEESRSRLSTAHFDVLMVDYHLKEDSAFHFLCCLRRDGIMLPAIVMSDNAGILRLTPKDLLNIPAVLLKPFTLFQLQQALGSIPLN